MFKSNLIFLLSFIVSINAYSQQVTKPKEVTKEIMLEKYDSLMFSYATSKQTKSIYGSVYSNKFYDETNWAAITATVLQRPNRNPLNRSFVLLNKYGKIIDGDPEYKGDIIKVSESGYKERITTGRHFFLPRYSDFEYKNYGRYSFDAITLAKSTSDQRFIGFIKYNQPYPSDAMVRLVADEHTLHSFESLFGDINGNVKHISTLRLSNQYILMIFKLSYEYLSERRMYHFGVDSYKQPSRVISNQEFYRILTFRPNGELISSSSNLLPEFEENNKRDKIAFGSSSMPLPTKDGIIFSFNSSSGIFDIDETLKSANSQTVEITDSFGRSYQVPSKGFSYNPSIDQSIAVAKLSNFGKIKWHKIIEDDKNDPKIKDPILLDMVSYQDKSCIIYISYTKEILNEPALVFTFLDNDGNIIDEKIRTDYKYLKLVNNRPFFSDFISFKNEIHFVQYNKNYPDKIDFTRKIDSFE